MKIILFNILRECNFRDMIMCQDLFLSQFYSFIDHPKYISPREDRLNLRRDCLNVNADLSKSIEECKREHDLIPA